MMRIMMEENQIHQDLIAKLWQVYSTLMPLWLIITNFYLIVVPTGRERQLPKPQRRGAIIILGMLAVARRSVVTDKVDVMLKIGLGAVGKVSAPRKVDLLF